MEISAGPAAGPDRGGESVVQIMALYDRGAKTDHHAIPAVVSETSSRGCAGRKEGHDAES
ncbi:MAG: hypothetical protein JWQ95_213 [Sphaerisporangium sp.]|nr:hypothetical protein [Sphaerisporangium sp.]